jgi:hypothetical protein
MASLRDQVGEILDNLCESTGIAEHVDGDFRVHLGDTPVWVRIYESPAAVSVFRAVAQEVPRSAELDELLHDHNAGYVVFRAFWEDDSVFLRADVPARPVVASLLQYVLETFDAEAKTLEMEMREWSGSGLAVPESSKCLADEAQSEAGSNRSSSASLSPDQGGDMIEGLAFKLTVTTNGESREFALGTRDIQAVVDVLPGNDPGFAGVFAAASVHPAAAVRASAARKECLPADAAMELANDPCATVRRAVVSSPFFRRLAKEEMILRMMEVDPEVAEAVADNLGRFEVANTDVLGEALLVHPDPNVRLRMAEGTCTSVKLLNKLCQDASPDVAIAARRVIQTRFR